VALRQQLDALHARPFPKRPGSRQTLFDTLDRPDLRPLPPTRYAYAEGKQARVHIAYHGEIRAVSSSVPSQLVRQEADVRLTTQMVAIFPKGRRVASMSGPTRQGRWSRIRPIGPAPISALGSGVGRASWPGPKRPAPTPARRDGADRLEAACGRALAIQSPTSRSVQAILSRHCASGGSTHGLLDLAPPVFASSTLAPEGHQAPGTEM
jgi:hypothetical protein